MRCAPNFSNFNEKVLSLQVDLANYDVFIFVTLFMVNCQCAGLLKKDSHDSASQEVLIPEKSLTGA